MASVPGNLGPRLVVRFGDLALDLLAARHGGALDLDIDEDVLAAGSLNPLLEAGPDTWSALRSAATRLADVIDVLPNGMVVADSGLTMHLPVRVGDYVDGYGGIHHAENMGRLLRPGTEPLAPNWKHMPVAYHGRASTIVVSGTPVTRPWGPVVRDGAPRLAPTSELDIELEVGAVVGVGNPPGCPIDVEGALDHVFGLVLLNDWSARDIQAFEARPLGPFLGKSFATSISAWVVPLEALRPSLVPGLAARQDPQPAPYLRHERPASPDLELEVLLSTASMRRAGMAPARVSHVRFADAMYWTMAQQLAHATVNGASTRPGDLFGSGTASGPDPRTSGGSFLELSWGGTAPLALPNGEERTFLEDGDTVVLRGLRPAGSRTGGADESTAQRGGGSTIELGDVVGTVVPARRR